MDQSQVNAELMAWLREAKDAVERQAPLLADEIVRWGIVGNAWAGIVAAIIGAAFLLTAYIAIRAGVKCKCEFDRALLVMGATVVACFGGVALFISTVCFYESFKAYFAPRVYVVDYIADKASK